MPEARYPDDHMRQMVADHARVMDDKRQRAMREQAFETRARQWVDEHQAAAERAGHEHLCYQYDQFGQISEIFVEDCAACWRDHEREQERRADLAERNRKEERTVNRAVACLALLVIGFIAFHGSLPI